MTRIFGSWIDRFAALERRYFAVDGGSGAALLALLPAVDDRLRPTDSPHHADLLLVVEPVTARLLDALVESHRRMSWPRQIVVAGERSTSHSEPVGGLVHLEDHLPVALRVEGSTTAEAASSTAAALARAIRSAPIRRSGAEPNRAPEEIFIPLRSAAEREIATEDVVLSIGPIQRIAAGPLRLLLLMDGEQVVRAQVRGGYAARKIEGPSGELTWLEGLAAAAALDPLAPVAGRMAYVQALESLHGVEPPQRALRLRDGMLHLERAANHLFWFARFAGFLAYDILARDGRRLAAASAAGLISADAVVAGGWDGSTAGRQPTRGLPTRLPEEVRRLARRLRADRLFALRTRGIGMLPAVRAREVGAGGAVLLASEKSDGDAWARTLARLDMAADDLEQATTLIGRLPEGRDRAPWPDAPPPEGAAESQITGPRGTLTLQLVSAGGIRPSLVHWARPSAVHVTLIPELVTGHTLPDALAAVASLDLSMVEADG